ncbi:MAG: L-ribulose-5-phosphate 4-epimerase AraD [Spirochaetales bacterium]|nr:L-ribulose-5-phosphate 4-epimerase AraD [Spirochaetales bacterium]
MSRYKELKAKTLKGNAAIPTLGLAMFTFGNLSVFDPDLRAVAIKPSGVSYNELTEEKIVVLDLDGQVLEGILRPSSDTPTHLHLYRAFPGLRSIVHTHSTYATAWAQSGRAIPVYGTTHADHCSVEIPCAPVMRRDRITGEYEKETAYQIIEHFEKLNLDSRHCSMVLIEGHGPFTWGKNPDEALYNAAVLEELARMAMFTEILAGGQKPPLPGYLIDKHFTRKHGPGAYYGQE